MNWKHSVPYAVLGLALVVLGAIIKSWVMLDEIANLSFPYLCSLIGLAVVMVGVHCLVFDAPPSRLELRPNLILFLVIAVLSVVDVVWDGIFKGYPPGVVIENAAGNSLEFVVIYAAILFLPRFQGKRESGEDAQAS